MRKLISQLLMTSCLFFSNTFANTHYIIDTDMGFDDWVAVLYLLKQPVQVDAITIDCQGETFCPQGAFNAARLTHLAKRDVPVALGQSRPKSNYDFPMAIRDYATAMHISDFSFLSADHDVVKTSAAQMILNSAIHAAKNHDHVAIISIGTAANIADAWELAKKEHKTAEFRQGLGMVYKGGGAFGEISNHQLTNVHIPGNIPIPNMVESNNTTAEWNIYANAPAMQTLLEARLPITFIPENASDQVKMTRAVYDTLLNNSQPYSAKRFTANAMMSLVKMQGGWEHSTGLDFWDTAATIAALNPNIVTEKFSKVPLKIILSENNNYGTTWVTKQPADLVTVYYQINTKSFYDLMEKGI